MTTVSQSLQKQPRTAALALVILSVVILVSLMSAAGVGQTAEPPKQASLQQVEVISIETQQNYQKQLQVVGRAESGEQTILGFERGGTVANAYVDEGQYVEKGQLLAELDLLRLQAQILEIDAAIKRAEADARLAKLSEKRIEQVVEDGLESPQRLDEAVESTKAAQALVQEMQARKGSVEVEIEKSKIYAPFSGVVVARPVDSGSVVAQGQSILHLLKNTQLQVRMAMSADKAFALDTNATYELENGRSSYLAKVISVGGNRDVRTRTVDVMFTLLPYNDSKPMVLQGDLLTLRIPVEIADQGFWVPKTALSSGIRGMWNLFSVPEMGQEQSLSVKAVQVLYSDEHRAFVAGTLQNGDLVVANGVHRLVPQQLVRVKEYNSQQVAGN